MRSDTRIRRVRSTVRAVRRAAQRHGLSPACVRGLASLAGAAAHRGSPLPYCRVLAIVEACASNARVLRWMEAA